MGHHFFFQPIRFSKIVILLVYTLPLHIRDDAYFKRKIHQPLYLEICAIPNFDY